MWITSTSLAVSEIMRAIAALFPSASIEVACLDSCFDHNVIKNAIAKFPGRDPVHADLFSLSQWIGHDVLKGFAGYDEFWLYERASNRLSQPRHALQSFGSDWDLEADPLPHGFKEDFVSCGALMVVSNCGIRNIVADKRYRVAVEKPGREIN